MKPLVSLSSSLFLALALLLALALGLAGVRTARADSPGDLDPTFGSGGLITETTDLAGLAVGLQSDGKIVVVGPGWTSPSLVRFTTEGSLDTGFGLAGIVTDTRITHIWNIAIQPDDKIIAAGISRESSPAPYVVTYDRFTVARYTPDGAPDLSFGSGGIVTTSLGSYGYAWDVALQPDDKIVAAGWSGGPKGDGFALVRYTAAGTLDPTFGQGGVVTTTPIDSGANGYAVVIQPDAKIVIAGSSHSSSDYPPDHPSCTVSSCFALARYTPDGLLDTSFGTGGIVTTQIGVRNFGHDLALQPDGKLLVAGYAGYDYFSNLTGHSGFAVARYTPAGLLDPGFGHHGVLTTVIGSAAGANALTLQPDGRILVIGDSRSSSTRKIVFALARYTTRGSLDPSFGRQGVVTTPFELDAYTWNFILQPDAKILVVGNSTFNGKANMALARYLGGGELWEEYLPVIGNGEWRK